MRSPSAAATITSAKVPSGDSRQRPTTTRTPLVEPAPAMAPWNRSRVTRSRLATGSTAPASAVEVPRAGEAEEAVAGEADADDRDRDRASRRLEHLLQRLVEAAALR